jgi:ketosteroid isomerase-like protein
MGDVSDQIKEVMQDLYNIVSNKDVERLSKVLADDVILHNADGAIVEGKEAYLKAASDIWPTIPDFTLTGEESRVVVSDSGDLGVSAGEHRSIFNESGEMVGKWLHTLVWKKNDDGWKMKVFSNIALPE